MIFKNSYTIYEKVTIISFVVFIFFEFFGTSLPFQPRIENVDEIGSSNLINQVVYTTLFLLSIYSLIPKWNDLIRLIKKEKMLSLFLLWCLISMAWSIDPFVTFKRLFRIITLFTVCTSFLLTIDSNKEILQYMKGVLYLYVFLSIISCLVVPGALDPEFHTWRGLTSQKNDLGQVSVVCILLSFSIFIRETGYAKMLAAIVTFFSVLLLFGSMSVTSISSFMFLVAIGILFSFDSIFRPIGLGRTVSALVILFIFSLIASFIIFDSDILRTMTNLVGKDITFSGRTDLWVAMFGEIAKHLYLGAGFQAFWSVSNPSVLILYESFNWLPNQAHNGYIDIINEVGLVGFSLFFIMLVRYFVNIRKLKQSNPWKWFVIIALIINLQESTFFRPGHLLGGMMVFSYLILFKQLLTQTEVTQDEMYLEDEGINENDLIIAGKN